MDAEELSRPGAKRDNLVEISRHVFDGHATAQDSGLSDCLWVVSILIAHCLQLSSCIFTLMSVNSTLEDLLDTWKDYKQSVDKQSF